MNNKTFLEEKEKLKEINNKVLEEEKLIEEELRKSDMNYTMEDIAKGEVLLTRVKKLENIKKIKNVPYFARMDFKEENRDLEKLYIGKISILDNKTAEPIIVDWRAPISNLYYEGKIGSAEYECLGKKIKGDILLKRQYIIEKKQLKKYIDINVTGNDELLQNALEEKADDRLKNIVATIQDEQNKIIRAKINSPLIVQGVAGSGKTTIALHRIAYLIYNYEKEFKPEEFMIIAPTKFFLNYISNILPDLGVNNVKQCTFEDFAYDVIGKKLKISDSNEKLVIIVNKEFDDINKGKIDIMIKEAKYKSSIKFKKIVDDYLLQIENNYIPKNDFYFKDYEIMSYNNINKLFKETYKMYNYNDRIKEIEKNLISELKKKSLLIIDDIRKKRSKELQNLTGENRIKVFDKYEKIIKLLEKDYKKIVKQYLNQISKKDCIQYYKEFIDGYLQNSDEVMIYLKKNTSNNLQKNEISFEDLAPIMYIQYKIFGIKEKCKIKHVVVDEAQDYGEFQFDILKQILNSNSMTILGDIAQGVHYYRGIENWKKFIDVEFKNVKTVYTTLNKTYRTTKEIMEVANNVINKLPEFEKKYIVLGEPVIDRKNSVNIKKNKNIDELISSINNRINEYLQNDYKSIAIIGKDMNECEEIEKKLRKTRKDIKLIKGKDSEYNSGISVVPSYLAKGLEFDCVIISNANEEKYTYSSLDIKLLYVTITRAMSKLDIFYTGEITGLLKNIVL
ncbi:dNA/RNA helicase superfamily I [Clostridium sp. CAG:571]|nr:dNA/RNA helicase superfamily I [Clostridium sp. CAG:571]HJJ07466.1 AAA family ATPase [Clostridiaceae bacterium]